MTAFADGTIWQYKCPFRKAWVDATLEEDQKLKEGYLASSKGSTEVAYLLNGVRFKTDFQSMSRMNVASKRKMEVRLRGGELPFPPPAGESVAAAGKEEAPPQKGAVLLSVDALNKGPEGKPVPFGVRRAWGHGVEAGVDMAGAFAFEMKVEDKDYLGEMLSWHMLSAGLEPSALNNQFLSFTSRHGQVVRGKDEISQMLKNTDSYPVSVVYKPAHLFKGLPEHMVTGLVLQRIQLKFVQEAVNAVGRNIMNVKHTHQRRTFERYLLYLEDHFYQTGDDVDLRGALDAFPAHIAYMGLIAKTGPNLTRVLKGEADILEFLFGG